MLHEINFEERLLVRTLAATCRDVRRASGVRQWQLAEEMLVQRSWLTKIESAKLVPRPLTLHRIARAHRLPGGWKLLQIAEARLDRRAGGPEPDDFRRIKKRFVSRLPAAISALDDASVAKAFGATIKAARSARGMSQADLGQRIGMPHNRICAIEHGHSCPGVVSLLRLAAALDTPAWNLMRCAEMRLAQPEPQPQTPAA